MSNLERAQTYAAIFIGAGDGWRQYVPVDATVDPDRDVMHLAGVRMTRRADVWVLEENGRAWLVSPKATAKAAAKAGVSA